MTPTYTHCPECGMLSVFGHQPHTIECSKPTPINESKGNLMTPQELLAEADAINKFLTNEDDSPDMMDFVDTLSSAETKLREAAQTIRSLQEQLVDARM